MSRASQDGLRSTFTSGALTIDVSMVGAVDGGARVTVVIDTGELVVRKFDVIAPLSAWVRDLAELTALRVDRATLATSEKEVELVLEHVAGNMRGHLRVRLTAGLPGTVEGSFPTTLTAVEQLHRGLEECAWALGT